MIRIYFPFGDLIEINNFDHEVKKSAYL